MCRPRCTGGWCWGVGRVAVPKCHVGVGVSVVLKLVKLTECGGIGGGASLKWMVGSAMAVTGALNVLQASRQPGDAGRQAHFVGARFGVDQPVDNLAVHI